jgi:Fe2+ or Zn2+ uptake regulation protein
MEKGITTVITIEENETRYDADTSIHGHFKCENCGKIYDFKVSFPQVDKNELKEFKIYEKQVYYKGKCKDCLK